MANGPNIGGGQNIADITGGIGDLLKGFVQGQQIRTQNEDAQAKIAEQRDKTGQEVSLRFQQQLRDRPDLANNQNYVKIAQHAAKQYGFALPVDATGGIDVNAFAPKPDIMAKLDTPEKVQAFQSLDASGQKAFASGYDTSRAPAGFIGTQVLPTTNTDKKDWEEFAFNQIKSMETGDATLDQIQAVASSIPENIRPFVPLDKIVNANPTILGKLAAGVTAKINKLVADGVLSKDKGQAILQHANSYDDLIKIQGEHFKTMDAVARGGLQERIRRDDQMQAQAQRNADLSEERIQAMIRGQNLRASVEERGQNIRGSGGGGGGKKYDPVAVAKGDVKDLQSFVGTLLARKTSLERDAKNAQDNGDDVPPELQSKIDEVNGQIDNYTKALTKAENALPTIEENVLKSHGVTGLPTATPDKDASGVPVRVPGAAPDPFSSTLERALTIVKGQPKSNRLQFAMGSPSFKQWYNTLTGTQRRTVLQSMQSLP